MANEKDIQQAKAVYDIIKGALDSNKWTYDKDEEKMLVWCSAQGDDLPMDINIRVDANRQMIILTSRIPVTFPEDKIVDAALAAAIINNHLVDGNFDLDISSGRIYYRMTACFLESLITRTLFDYMMISSMRTIDDFNDKLLMLSKGYISLEQIEKFFQQ